MRFYFWRTCVWVESVDVSIEPLTQTYLIPRHYTKELFYTNLCVYETISILLLYFFNIYSTTSSTLMPTLIRLLSSPFFQNKFVLYASLFLVLLSILRYISNQNFNAVILITLIGLITSYFSKNMIIVLLTAVVSVFVLEMIGSPGVTEGMATKEGNTGSKDKSTEGDDDDDDSSKEDSEKMTTVNDKPTGETPVDKPVDKPVKKPDEKTKIEGNQTQTTNKSKNKQQGMTKLSPAVYNESNNNNDKNANRIDYANTLEQAYDNIENIIGEEGVRGLTDQTKSLMNQQKQLMENMKEMGPLLQSAEGFMKQMTGNGGIAGITEMLKGFATPGGKK